VQAFRLRQGFGGPP